MRSADLPISRWDEGSWKHAIGRTHSCLTTGVYSWQDIDTAGFLHVKNEPPATPAARFPCAAAARILTAGMPEGMPWKDEKPGGVIMYQASSARYQSMDYRRCGESGLLLPAVSLGLWHNFGDTASYENMERLCFTAFDNGITHFDLANNYGPAPGSAEKNFGRILRENFLPYRDELIISTKAPMETGGAGNTCSPAWTRACGGWGSSMWTSSTTTGWIPIRRWRRRWARWRRPCRAGRRSTRASPTTTARRWKRRRRSCGSCAAPSSSTRTAIPSSTGRSSRTASRRPRGGLERGSSSSARWRRGC